MRHKALGIDRARLGGSSKREDQAIASEGPGLDLAGRINGTQLQGQEHWAPGLENWGTSTQPHSSGKSRSV